MERRFFHRLVCMGAVLGMILALTGCVSPVATYQEALKSYSEGSTKVLATQQEYYLSGTSIAFNYSIRSGIAGHKNRSYEEIQSKATVSPDQLQLRIKTIAEIIAYNQILVQIAEAKDAVEFQAQGEKSGQPGRYDSGEPRRHRRQRSSCFRG